MKKIGILHPEISAVVASMGHTDMLVIADAGLPIPDHAQRIDLALSEGIPPFLKTTEVILSELKVQEAIIAEEMLTRSPHVYEELRQALPDIPIKHVPHETFKQITGEAKAIIRTGEFTPYANVILVSGVTF